MLDRWEQKAASSKNNLLQFGMQWNLDSFALMPRSLMSKASNVSDLGLVGTLLTQSWSTWMSIRAIEDLCPPALGSHWWEVWERLWLAPLPILQVTVLWLGSTPRNLWDDVPCSFSEPLLYLTVFVCLFVCWGGGKWGGRNCKCVGCLFWGGVWPSWVWKSTVNLSTEKWE